MLNAAKQEVEIVGKSGLTVSGDGSWKRRGQSSKCGIVNVTGDENGNVLHIEVMSSMKNSIHGQKLADGKHLSGKIRLSYNFID